MARPAARVRLPDELLSPTRPAVPCPTAKQQRCLPPGLRLAPPPSVCTVLLAAAPPRMPHAHASGKFVHARQPSVSSQSALAVPQRLAGGASIDHDPRRDLLAADRARIVARVPLEPPALVHCGRRHRGHGRASADSAAAARRRRTRRWRRSSSSRRCCCRWDLLARLAALGSAAVAVHAVARLPAVHVCVCVRCLAASHAQATLLRLLGPGLQHVLLNSENPTRNRIPLDRKSRCGIPPSANSRALVVRAAASAEGRCRAHRAVPRTPR